MGIIRVSLCRVGKLHSSRQNAGKIYCLAVSKERRGRPSSLDSNLTSNYLTMRRKETQKIRDRLRSDGGDKKKEKANSIKKDELYKKRGALFQS